MGKKLFVGGLSWGTSDDGLRQAFERFGAIVEAKVIMDRETGRSRGFGFVTFEQDDAAANAISQMDGTDLDGRTIKVNEAEERGPRGGGGGGGGGGRGGSRGGGGGGRRDRW
jgi:RNA recognition motif-containing protein